MVSFEQIAAYLDFSRPPVSPERVGAQYYRVACHRRRLWDRPLQTSLVIAGARVQLPFPDRVLVVQADVLMAIDVEVAGIVEDGPEIRRWNPFIARAEQSLQGEPVISQRSQNVLIRFIVGVAGDAVVVRRIVELRKKQGLALAVVKSAGEQARPGRETDGRK